MINCITNFKSGLGPMRNLQICLAKNYIGHRKRFAQFWYFLNTRRNDHSIAGPQPSNESPGLRDFLQKANYNNASVKIDTEDDTPYLCINELSGHGHKVLLEIYGCQMNVNDAEIILSILTSKGYTRTHSHYEADAILLVTCAIREGAEGKVWERLHYLRSLKRTSRTKANVKIGLLGCMAERLKQKVLEIDKTVDLVAGPDSYKDLPRLLSLARDNQAAINVQLSLDETYADVMPVRISPDAVSAYVSIMRGCDNMCTYCIVPFTRGRERSRPVKSIVEEVRELSLQGVKEVTLLGQNVNSYRDTSEGSGVREATRLTSGFSTVYKPKVGGLRFAKLLADVAAVDPEMRIRFTSPHPKDFPDEVLDVIASHSNVCGSLHLPAQAGNSAVLERMRRGYSREAYCELVQRVRSRLPQVAISSDFIAGFCGETAAEFAETLTLIREVKYNTAFLFAYSMREKTTAHRRLADDVPKDVKNQRVSEMSQAFRETVRRTNHAQVGQTQLVLVEGLSKRSDSFLAGRNDGNVRVILPRGDIPVSRTSRQTQPLHKGQYVAVLINDASSQVLKGIPLYHSGIESFHNEHHS